MSTVSTSSLPNTLSQSSSNASEEGVEEEKWTKPSVPVKHNKRPSLGFRRHSAVDCTNVTFSPEETRIENTSRTASFKRDVYRKMSTFGVMRAKAIASQGCQDDGALDPRLENSAEHEEAKQIYSDLSKLLEAKIHIVLFHQYLQTTYCHENLDFYQRVEVLKEEKSLSLAQSIYSEFISNSSRTPINIRGTSKKNIVKHMENAANLQSDQIPEPLLEDFLEAQAEIFVLMEADSFQRFLNSQHSKEWKLSCFDYVKERKKRSSPFAKFHLHRRSVGF
eukprot:c27696_g1_i1.p1 GENE.c27696_g1_i1~~c27696_g1_i1.p1  ORF type:complete len:278 (+),score=86.20 c27696_g1_i1:27-860(+)